MRTDHAHQLTEKAAHGELAGKAELLGLLASVSQEFVASPVMGETLANATQKILDYMDTEAVSIFLLDASQQHLTCRLCRPGVDRRTDHRCHAGHCRPRGGFRQRADGARYGLRH
ncbi:MAG: hypothetical protein IPO00_07550 [Betaproteobacteria bacterium]|nr:hypothetical protein [Betaproteobacteria bacterium]